MTGAAKSPVELRPGSACDAPDPLAKAGAATVEKSSPRSVSRSRTRPVAQCPPGATRSVSQVTKQTHEPGPGRSTSDAAFAKLKKEIAQRNEQAHKEARKLRAARERHQVRRRRQDDLR
jgi:hypothetical protein